MDRIHASIGVYEPESGFTVEEYAQRYRLPVATAAGRIKRMARDQTIKRLGKRRVDGRWCAVYDFT